MRKGERRDPGAPAQCRFERGDGGRRIGSHPALLVIRVLQPHAGRRSPGELRQQLVLLVPTRIGGVAARLTVEVAEVLVTGKEPRPTADKWSAKVGREIPVPLARVPGPLRLARFQLKKDRLAGERGRLRVVGKIVNVTVAPLSRDDLEHGTLNVSELRGRAGGPHLDLLNEVDAELRASDAVARARRIGAVDEKGVLVHAGAENGHRRRRRTRGRARGCARRGTDRVEHARSPTGCGAQVVAVETRLQAARTCLQLRSAHDAHGLGDAGQREFHQLLDGRACAETDAVLVVRGEPRSFDVEHVRSGDQAGEPEPAARISAFAQRSADERG